MWPLDSDLDLSQDLVSELKTAPLAVGSSGA